MKFHYNWYIHFIYSYGLGRTTLKELRVYQISYVLVGRGTTNNSIRNFQRIEKPHRYDKNRLIFIMAILIKCKSCAMGYATYKRIKRVRKISSCCVRNSKKLLFSIYRIYRQFIKNIVALLYNKTFKREIKIKREKARIGEIGDAERKHTEEENTTC